MRFSVQNWIEEVKAKPEHIRYRYMVGCVGCSMFFVVIVWSLTISETFKQTVNKQTAETVGSMLPKSSNFSLDQILSGEGSLQPETPRTGEEFLREQEANRTKLDPNEEGIRPKGDEVPEEEVPTGLVMPTLP